MLAGMGLAMPGAFGLARLGVETGPETAFANAGRLVTKGGKCARSAFIDRNWCGHPVALACCIDRPNGGAALAGRCRLVANGWSHSQKNRLVLLIRHFA